MANLDKISELQANLDKKTKMNISECSLIALNSTPALPE